MARRMAPPHGGDPNRSPLCAVHPDTKETSTAAAGSRCRYESILDAALQGICGLDGQGRIDYVNRAAEGMLGCSRSELLGRSHHVLFWPAPSGGTSPSLDSCPVCIVLSGGEACRDWESVFVNADGRCFAVELDCAPRELGNGETGAILVFRDVTERKRLEQERARLRAIIEDTPDFVITTNAEGEVIHLNRAARALFGIAEHERPTGRRIDDYYPDWAKRLVWEEGMPTAARHGSWSHESAFLLPDGREVPVSQVLLSHKDVRGDVAYYSTIARDISERKRLEERLHYLATHDLLTGLTNRSHFQKFLADEVERARQDGTRGAVLFIDLDNFKEINDTFGHQKGDEVLTRIAHILKGNLREGDVIARLGGDEFAAVLPRTELREARQVAERLLALFQREVLRSKDRIFTVRASIGIAPYPHPNACAQSLLGEADLAMYAAKRLGGHRISVRHGDGHETFPPRTADGRPS